MDLGQTLSPLSSYLFLICIDRLTALFQKFENRKLISRVKVGRSAPPITHMLFADNSYIFCKANPESSNNTLQLLHIFEQASGHKIYIDKSSVFLSNNSHELLKRDLCQKLGLEKQTIGVLT